MSTTEARLAQARTSLRIRLCQIYDTRQAVRLIISDATLDPYRFEFEGRLEDVWSGVLYDTEKMGRTHVEALTGAIRGKYPDNGGLAVSVREYLEALKATSAEQDSTAHAPENRSTSDTSSGQTVDEDSSNRPPLWDENPETAIALIESRYGTDRPSWACWHLAVLYARARRNAIEVRSLLDLARQRDAEENRPASHLWLGYVLSCLGLDHRDEARANLRSAASSVQSTRQERGVAQDRLGAIDEDDFLFDNAVRRFEWSLIEKRAAGDRYGQRITLGRLGRLYRYMGKPAEAVQRLGESLKSSVDIPALERGMTHIELAESLFLARDVTSALSHLAEVESDDRHGDRSMAFAAVLRVEIALESNEVDRRSLWYARRRFEAAGFRAGLALVDEIEGLSFLVDGMEMGAEERFATVEASAAFKHWTPLYRLHRFMRRADAATRHRCRRVAACSLDQAERIASEHTLPAMDEIVRLRERLSGSVTFLDSRDQSVSAWLLSRRETLSRPFASVLTRMLLRPADVLLHVDELIQPLTLILYAEVERVGAASELPTYSGTISPGTRLNALRECAAALGRRDVNCLFPQQMNLFKSLNRLIEIRNQWVHRGKASVVALQEVLPVLELLAQDWLSQIEFRLKTSTAGDRPLVGWRDVVPEGIVFASSSTGSFVVDCSRVIRSLRGGLALSELPFADEWKGEDGSSTDVG